MAPPKDIVGSKGGSKSRTPIEAPDSLYSTATARVLDLLSEGDLEMWVSDDPLKDIFLDGTPVMNEDGTLNFSSVQVDWRPGTPNQSYIKGFPSVKSETAISYELKQGSPWVRSINNTELSAVSVRLATPQLTSTNQENGDTNGARVEYAIDLSTDGGAYENVLTSAFDGKTKSLYERGHRIDLPPSTSGWQIRIRRLTPDSNTQYLQNKMFVQSITEIIDAKLRYPYSAVVGLAFDAQQFRSIPTRAYRVKGRIVRIPTNYDPITRQYSGAWDGTFKLGWTNNPAWIWYDLATNQRYGLGRRVDESRIDRWSLYKIAVYCDGLVPDGKGGMEPRFTCTVYLQTAADAYKVMQDLASVFRGISYWAGGSIIALADQPEDPVYTYNNANVVDGRFIYNGSGRKARHTMALVAWSNPENMGKGEVEPVVDEMGIIRYGIQTKRITAFGASSRSQAQRVGRWVLASERLETDAAQWSVGLDGTLVAPGKVVRVFDENRAGRRLGGRISTVGSTHIIVDKLPDPLPQPGDKIFTITPSGAAQESLVSSVVESTRRINVATTFPERPVPQSVWGIETAEIKAQLFRVLGVTDNGDGTFGMSGIQHEPGKFAEVELGVYTEPRPIRVLPADTAPAPTNLTLTYDERAGRVLTSTIINADWDDMPGVSHYFIQWKKDENEWGPEIKCTGSNADYENAFPGVYYARVWAVTQNGSISPYTIADPLVVGDQTMVPGVVQELEEEVDTVQEIVDGMLIDFANVRDRVEDVQAEAQQAAADLNARADALRGDIDAEIDRAVAAEGELALRANQLRSDMDVLAAQLGDILEADEWDAETDYPSGDMVQSAGKLYRALQDVPAGTPVTNTAYWEYMGEYASLGEAVAANLRETLAHADELEAHASSLNLIGAKNAQGTAFVLNMDTVRVSATETLAQWRSGLQAQFDDANARIDTESQARADADSALASQAESLRVSLADVKAEAAVTFRQPDEPDMEPHFGPNIAEGAAWGAMSGAGVLDELPDGRIRLTTVEGLNSSRRIAAPVPLREGVLYRIKVDAENLTPVEMSVRTFLENFSAAGGVNFGSVLPGERKDITAYLVAPPNAARVGAQGGSGINPGYSIVMGDLAVQQAPVGSIWHQTNENDEVIGTYRYNGSDWDSVADSSKASVQSVTDLTLRVDETEDGITALGQRADSLEGIVNDPDTGLPSKASNTRVDTVETTLDEATGDLTALSETMSLLGTETADGQGFVFDLARTRVSVEETFGQRLASIQSAFGDANARIDAEETARADADAAQVGRISTMEARMPSGSGGLATAASVTAEATARANADSAQVSRIETMESRMPTGTGDLATAQSVTQVTNRVSTVEGKVETHTQQISDHTAEIAGKANSSTVTALTNTVTQQGNTLTAHGTQLSGLSASVGDNSASINELREVSVNAVGGNAVLDPSFETGSGWPTSMPSGFSYFNNQASANSGMRSLRIDSNGSGSERLFINNGRGAVRPGQTVRAGGWLRYGSQPNASARLYLHVRWYDVAGSTIANTIIANLTRDELTTSWQLFQRDVQAPLGAAQAALQVYTPEGTHAFGDFRVDDVFLEPQSNTLSEMLAKYSLAVQAGGDVAGMQLLAGGGISAIRFLANSFQIVDPGGTAKTEYSAGTWTVHDSSGRLRMKWGVW